MKNRTALEILFKMIKRESFGAHISDLKKTIGLIESLKIHSDHEVVLGLKEGKKISCSVSNNSDEVLVVSGKLNQIDVNKEIHTNEDLVDFLKNFI